MTMSATSELTMAPKAAPMITPTARSTTLPLTANSRNSLNTLASSARDKAVGPERPAAQNLYTSEVTSETSFFSTVTTGGRVLYRSTTSILIWLRRVRSAVKPALNV